jgi:hypothetical protein
MRQHEERLTMTAPAYILSETTLTLFHDGTPIIAHNTHPRWAEILTALKEKRFDDLAYLARPIVAITRYLVDDPDFVVVDQTVLFNGEPIHEMIASRLIQHMKDGISTKPLANFTRRLANNPDYWVAEQLYPFLEKGKLPITEDGYFLAYKRIRQDWTDVYSGTVNYAVGNVVTMPRQKVDNDRARTCSSGLHACSLEYLNFFSGDRIVAVQIDPADVVSVPADYNDTKLRCCRMKVVAELDNNLAAPAWTSPVFDYPEELDEDEDESGAENEDPKFFIRDEVGNFWNSAERSFDFVNDCEVDEDVYSYHSLAWARTDMEALRVLGHKCRIENEYGERVD